MICSENVERRMVETTASRAARRLSNKKNIYKLKLKTVEFNVRFDVRSRHRGRGRQICATLPKGERNDCHGLPSAGFEPTLDDAGFESNRLRPLGHHAPSATSLEKPQESAL